MDSPMLSHPLSIILIHYKAISYKNQEDSMKKRQRIIHLSQKSSIHPTNLWCGRPIHKLFTEIPDFPLAFLERLGYYILALREKEC
jgi:hypothetical protein